MVIINYVLMCAIFGTTFLAIKIGVEAGLPPFFSAGLRFTIAGLLLLGWMMLQRKVRLSILLRKELVFVGLSSTFMTFAALYWAEQYVDSGMAAILSATGPMMILGMQAAARTGQSAGRSVYFGCVIGFAGVVVLLLPKLVVGTDALWIASCIVILLGELGYAAGSLMSRKVMFHLNDVSPIAINAVQMLYGGLALLVLSAFSEKVSLDSLLTFPAAGSLFYLIVFGSMLGHSLYAWLIKATNAFFPSTWLYISPLIAMALGVLFYNEHVSIYSILGSLLVISGIIVTNLRQIRSHLSSREQRQLRSTAS
ncbi:drug/metabolite transporter (DMT)-like permease [Paenibacillus phyllosphaerae]|uniref:Drug/metabolite transporter (DMT)-like permease n=1 Tax=Paenibacillus phyllosphaerae TaxID=274593 RepID=A0A7W5FQP7_9BACL|nr:EamA family transporter [Paenibacillus phyllosphaerae]MBB3113472.1 drug/metabolite transporter (DMT)-like permease [Paenibacillus phyllosphaerae]